MVVTEDYQGKIILILSTGNAKEKTGKSYIFFDRKFALKNILPASYTATVIFDKDGNGVWTPGSLIENRLPEKRVVVKEPILIRANWELTKQIINVSLKGSKKKTEPKPQDKPNLK
jgi:hypothetical protein